MLHRSLLCAVAAIVGSPALAADVEFEGSYQSRARLFDSLSLTTAEDAGLPEGRAFYGEHRLWLRPRFLFSDDVRLTLDFRGLDNVPWGGGASSPRSFLNQPVLEEGLSAPTSDDPAAPLLDFTLWRVWSDIDTAYGRISFGRMPLHWGMGIWQNDGMGLNAEFGDTADRIQFETLIQDTLFVRAALDTHAENFVNDQDDTYAASAAVAYRSERFFGGLQAHYRYAGRPDTGNNLNLFTVDAAVDAELGKLSVSAEGLARFGGGDLPGGFNDVNITGFGAALDAELIAKPWRITLQGGFASGDKDDTDARIKTFSFDRDHNVGVILFEQPMPIFRTNTPSAANGNRTFDQVLLGNAVSNALYLRPSIARELVDGLELEGTVLIARAAALPERFGDRGNYGTELQGALRWTGLQHVEFDGRFGVFLPGSYFRNFQTDTIDGFDRTALGAQLTGRVRF